jgi:MFS transporter, ACS family, tartrate transporter
VNALLTKLRWRLLPFLFLLYVVAYLDRVNVGFAALQMKSQLNFSDSVYGLGAGIFFLGYFLFQVPSNIVLERVGARRWIAVLMVLWGIISSSMLFVHSAHSFYTMRFLLGAAEAGFFPGVIFYLRQWFPPAVRAGVLALFATAGPVSGVIGGLISGALLDLNQRGGLAGWQWMFLFEGMPAVLLGAASYLYLSDKPESAPWLSTQEKDWLRDATQPSGFDSTAPIAHVRTTWFADPRLWAFALVYFGLNTCTYGVSLWSPSVLRHLSVYTNLVTGFLAASIPNLVAVVAMVLVGANSDRLSERRWHIAVSAFSGALALVLAGFSNQTGWNIVGFSIALAASSSMIAPMWAMANDVISPAAAARSIALINSVGNLGSGIGPYVIGRLRDATGEFRAGLLGVAFLLAVAGFTILSIRQPRRAP